jgi:3-dehydroquinate dehydratase I
MRSRIARKLNKDAAGRMNVMRSLLDGGVPLVAVSFRDDDSERLAREAEAAGVDVAELRIDQFSRTDTDHVLAQVRQFRNLPVLATVRAQREGGGWTGTELQRLELFRALVPVVDAVDIELSSSEILSEVVESAKHNEKVVIISYHDFETTPALGELEVIVNNAKESGADYVKVSTMATSENDVRTLASLTLQAGHLGLVVIAMGAVGAVSRVFFPALGSRLTYAFIGDRTAPGQLDHIETCHLLRKFYPSFDQKKILPMRLLEDA